MQNRPAFGHEYRLTVALTATDGWKIVFVFRSEKKNSKVRLTAWERFKEFAGTITQQNYQGPFIGQPYLSDDWEVCESSQ